jgi:ATP-binding cassette subfamily B protein
VRAWVSIATLLAKTSPRTRLVLGVVVVLAVLARVSVIVAAVSVARSDANAATLSVIVAGGLYALERAALAVARAGVECDLHRMTARALLQGDILEVPAADVSRVVYEGAYHGIQLLTGILPSLVADGVVASGAIPLLAATLPLRLVVLAAGALVIVMLGLFVVQSSMQRLEQRTRDAYQMLSDTMTGVVEGRLEIVARGGEPEIMRALEEQLRVFLRTSVRAAYGTAFLGRAPIVAAALSVGVAVLADATSRELLASAVLANALLLAAALRPMFGAIIALQGAVRTLTFVRPFIDLLNRPPRLDATQEGGVAPELPASIELDELSFGYDSTPPVLSNLTFSWSGSEPLVLAGANGSGKSTLLRLLLGLRPPTSGALRIAGRELGTLDLRELRHAVAYLPQRPYLGEPHTTVRAAMKLGCPDASDEAIRRTLERTGILEAFAEREDPLLVSVGELSAGQRQRVALARVLLNDGAKVVLLDEPDANLDREGISLAASLVRELAAARKMVVVVAHTAELTAVSERRLELGALERERRAS